MALFIAAMVDASTTIDSELCGLTTVIAKCLHEKSRKSQSVKLNISCQNFLLYGMNHIIEIGHN